MKGQISIQLVAVVLCIAFVCLLSPAPAWSQQNECDEEIFAWAINDTILVTHAGAYYNCCAFMVVAMETPEPFVVDFLETETFPIGPCYCMCCLDINMWGFGFEPGHYTIRVWNDSRTVLYGETEVDVYGDPLTQAEFGGYSQSECLDSSSVPDEPRGTTWGRIKSTYE